MKKKDKNNKTLLIVIISIISFLLVLLLILILILSLFLVHKNTNTNGKDIKLIGTYQDRFIEDNYKVLKSYNDYVKTINEGNLKNEDFLNSNYLLIEVNYDECSEDNIEPKSYTIKDNNINIVFTYDASCGLCAPQYMYYLLRIDKSMTNPKVKIDYKRNNNPHCNPNVSYKPLIYLYPEKDTYVTVKLDKKELLTTTYPKYNNEWKVLAKPNGDLYDENNKYYYGLYWEGINKLDNNYEDGFVVEKDNLIEFLENKLKVLGLNNKERNEFIMYWLPQLEENKYNLIRFESIDTINEQMNLSITPTPDTIIRVLMKYKPIDKKINIKEQELTTPERNGFTVVEWGGTIIK